MIDENALGDWILRQRWFASKAREVAAFHVLELATLEGDPDLAIALVEVRFHPGTHELYQVPLGLREAWDGEEITRDERGRVVYDALTDPACVLRLVRAIGEDQTVERDEAQWRFRPSGPLPEALEPVRTIGVEQSNSSIVLGDEAILKVYRRIEPGPNPELELLRFLTEHGYPNIAHLTGWYEHDGRLVDATLGLLQEFLPDAQDGWALALDGFERDGGEGLLDQLGELGQVSGRLHATLAADRSDPTFAPEEPSQEALALLIATIDEEIERIFLELPDDDRVAPIRGRGEEVRERVRLYGQVGSGGRVIRTHGDFHLGQTLRAKGGWVLLDFEGEPARSLPERRRKRSPLRDVAGMLRSFSYAASGAQLLRGVSAPDDWEDRARARFLEGYRATVDQTLLPPSPSATERVLAIYELEKAVYELRYELNNRPDWVGIPVAGIARIIDGEVAT
jgi:trehalose synthase-fused probable maltokinase